MAEHPVQPTGVIYDLGYQRYAGQRLGRLHARRALYTYSLSGAFGVGRGGKAKILPFTILAIVVIPVLVIVAMTSVTGREPPRFDAFVYAFQLPIAVFLAAQAPELLCRDQRYRVLPLYFSRPIRRDDYSIAKLAAMASALFVLMGGPLLVLYIGVLLTITHNVAAFQHQSWEFLLGLTNVAVHAVVLGALGLAIASFTRRRAMATGAIIGVYLVSSAVGSIFSNLPGRGMRYAGVLDPFELLDGFKVWALHGKAVTTVGPVTSVYGLGTALLLAVSVGVLVLRYRKVAA